MMYINHFPNIATKQYNWGLAGWVFEVDCRRSVGYPTIGKKMMGDHQVGVHYRLNIQPRPYEIILNYFCIFFAAPNVKFTILQYYNMYQYIKTNCTRVTYNIIILSLITRILVASLKYLARGSIMSLLSSITSSKSINNTAVKESESISKRERDRTTSERAQVSKTVNRVNRVNW